MSGNTSDEFPSYIEASSKEVLSVESYDGETVYEEGDRLPCRGRWTGCYGATLFLGTGSDQNSSIAFLN